MSCKIVFLLIEYLRDLHEILEKSNLSILFISISALSNGKNYGEGRLVKYEPHSSCFTEARFANILRSGWGVKMNSPGAYKVNCSFTLQFSSFCAMARVYYDFKTNINTSILIICVTTMHKFKWFAID